MRSITTAGSRGQAAGSRSRCEPLNLMAVSIRANQSIRADQSIQKDKSVREVQSIQKDKSVREVQSIQKDKSVREVQSIQKDKNVREVQSTQKEQNAHENLKDQGVGSVRKDQKTLRITEIFHSLQGESITVGLPTVFVRLTGCPLRCQYCDTAYAFNGGDVVTMDHIVSQVGSYQCPQICVTGGEPLAQPNCLLLLKALCDLGYFVSLETSGARDVSGVDSRVSIVMDLKTPDSGECNKNNWSNLSHLKASDLIKFVLCSREDYLWACQILTDHQLAQKVQVLFSPSWGQLNPTLLADWIIQDRLPVRFQIQLHKILWNDAPGH